MNNECSFCKNYGKFEERNNLVRKPIYHSTKFFAEHLLAIEMKKT